MDFNSQSGNPFGNVMTHFLILSHTCGPTLKFENILLAYFHFHVFILIGSPFGLSYNIF